MFKEELGVVEAFPAELKLQPDAEQRFLKISKFRAPEYNIREQLNKTLDDMEADGRLISVDSSPIVSPMRVVVKKDGSLRICGDYKRTLNPLLDTKQYPLPTPEDCFYQIFDYNSYPSRLKDVVKTPLRYIQCFSNLSGRHRQGPERHRHVHVPSRRYLDIGR